MGRLSTETIFSLHRLTDGFLRGSVGAAGGHRIDTLGGEFGISGDHGGRTPPPWDLCAGSVRSLWDTCGTSLGSL